MNILAVKKLVKSKFLLDAMYRLVSSVFIIFLGVGTSIFLNRQFGASQYGLLVLAYSVPSIAMGIIHLGARPSIHCFVPQMMGAREKQSIISHFVFTCFIFLLIGCSLSILIMYFSREF